MIPRIAIVGRPNVGKSTLLNRLARRRVSIVHDMPGVTRDRVSIDIELGGKVVEIIDTGGIGIVDEGELDEDIHAQIDAAIGSAELILFLVDGRAGVHPLDERVAGMLRGGQREIMLVANKCEADGTRDDLGEFYSLGLGDPHPIAAAHGDGVTELIEAAVERLPDEEAERRADPTLRIAIVGRRNAGKSTFVNGLLQEERVIVSDIPGTTRDAVDVRFEKDGKEFVAVDTAGILRKAKLKDDVEYYAQVRSMDAIRRCDVVIFLIDGVHGVSQLDKRIAHEVMLRHRPVVIAVNKWDLVKDHSDTEKYEEYLSKQLPALHFAPVVFVTAKESKNVASCIGLVQSLAKQASQRVGTGVLNRAIDTIRERVHYRARPGKAPKIYFATQVDVLPPTVVLMVNRPGFFAPAYKRAIENHLRELLPFPEVPIHLIYRRREGER